MITVIFNDAEIKILAETTLQELMIKLEVNNCYSAFAVNTKFIPRPNYESTLLSHGDIIYQVTPMQGG